jgi:hypothetical protein
MRVLSDSLADWRVVTVVGRVMLMYVNSWYLRRTVTPKAAV